MVPDTRYSLLFKLHDHTDQQAWQEFAGIYEPVVYRVARSRGLQDCDAQDVVQSVMLSIAGAVQRWEPDPERGRFRTWLQRIAINRTLNVLRRDASSPRNAGDFVSECDHHPPTVDDPVSALIHHEYRREVFRRAATQVAKEVQADTWRAFWMTTIEGVSVDVAARELGKGKGAIYACRSRVMRRLKELVSERGE